MMYIICVRPMSIQIVKEGLKSDVLVHELMVFPTSLWVVFDLQPIQLNTVDTASRIQNLRRTRVLPSSSKCSSKRSKAETSQTGMLHRHAPHQSNFEPEREQFAAVPV